MKNRKKLPKLLKLVDKLIREKSVIYDKPKKNGAIGEILGVELHYK